MCSMPQERQSMVNVFDQVRVANGVAPRGDGDVAQAYNEEQAGAAGRTGAAQTATSGSAAQPAGATVAPGVSVKGYGGKGTRNVRNTVGGDDYSDINRRRKKKTASAGIGL